MKRKYLILIIIILFISGYFLLKKEKPILVKEIPLKSKVVKKTVSASGVVKSQNEANLAFSSTGKLLDLNVNDGDVVEQNQYIGMLENYSESFTAQSYKDTRDVALRDRDIFIEEYESNKDAVGGKDEYAIKLRRLDELVSKAESAYQAQIASANKAYMYAPFKGTVIDTMFEEGETVVLGSTVVKIADIKNLVFEISIDQEDFGYLTEGMEVEIKLDSYEDVVFKGKINTFPKYVNTAETNDFKVNVEFDLDSSDVEEEKRVLLGMTGDAYIILATTENEVSALTYDEVLYDIEDNAYVYIEENSKAVKKDLEIGLQGDIYTEIITKLDKPTLQPVAEKDVLEEGDLVKVKNK